MTKIEMFDAARYLLSPASQAELLDDAVATGDVNYIAHAREVIARARELTGIASAMASQTNPTSRD
jgi:DNA-binding phage protein